MAPCGATGRHRRSGTERIARSKPHACPPTRQGGGAGEQLRGDRHSSSDPLGFSEVPEEAYSRSAQPIVTALGIGYMGPIADGETLGELFLGKAKALAKLPDFSAAREGVPRSQGKEVRLHPVDCRGHNGGRLQVAVGEVPRGCSPPRSHVALGCRRFVQSARHCDPISATLA